LHVQGPASDYIERGGHVNWSWGRHLFELPLALSTLEREVGNGTGEGIREGRRGYRVDFDAPAIVEEDFELWLAKDIPVIYIHQSQSHRLDILLKSTVKLSEVVGGVMIFCPVHSLYESMATTFDDETVDEKRQLI